MPRTFEDDLISDARHGFVSDFSKVVTYSRGSNQSNDALSAVPVKPGRMIDLEATSPNTEMDLDWLVVAADLTLDDEATLPRPGDRITATIGGAEMVFVVTAREALPCYEWADAFRAKYRIRTTRVRNG